MSTVKSYDVAFRHNQALDPSALNTITNALFALVTAIDDCRNSGTNAETDAAVVLLDRHLGSIATADRPAAIQLRRQCIDAIAEIKRNPALLVLAIRGVSHDEDAKRQFHADGKRAMKRLADELGLGASDYDLRSNRGGIAVSGEITLHSDEVYVQLSLGSMGPDREVMYRRVRSRNDYTGERNHFASVRDLLAPDRFADRLARELTLRRSLPEPTRLFA